MPDIDGLNEVRRRTPPSINPAVLRGGLGQVEGLAGVQDEHQVPGKVPRVRAAGNQARALHREREPLHVAPGHLSRPQLHPRQALDRQPGKQFNRGVKL